MAQISVSRSFCISALLVMSFVLLCSGCGKKAWPEPQVQHEVFSWESATAERKQTCMVVQAKLRGNWKNLSTVAVELAREDCAGCPFQPDERREYPAGSAMAMRSGHHLTVNVCGLDPNSAYRWRLVGINSFKELNEVKTNVRLSPRIGDQ